MRLLTLVLFAAALSARTYSVDGVVVAVDPVSRTMLVSHRPIAGYMDAMLMPFHVADAHELAGVHPGSRVQFDLAVGRESSVARNVRRTGETDAPAAQPGIAIGE